MKRQFTFCLLLLGMASACTSPNKVLRLTDVPRYDPAVNPSMLFMTFEVIQKNKKEKVRLMNSAAAAGKVKNLEEHIHGEIIVQAIVHYKDAKPPRISRHAHPLYQVVEVPQEDHTFKKAVLTAKKGSLTIRIPSEGAMESLELYSLSPGKSPQKIFNLKFK